MRILLTAPNQKKAHQSIQGVYKGAKNRNKMEKLTKKTPLLHKKKELNESTKSKIDIQVLSKDFLALSQRVHKKEFLRVCSNCS